MFCLRATMHLAKSLALLTRVFLYTGVATWPCDMIKNLLETEISENRFSFLIQELRFSPPFFLLEMEQPLWQWWQHEDESPWQWWQSRKQRNACNIDHIVNPEPWIWTAYLQTFYISKSIFWRKNILGEKIYKIHSSCLDKEGMFSWDFVLWSPQITLIQKGFGSWI